MYCEFELSYKLGFKSEKADYNKFHCIGNINLFISRYSAVHTSRQMTVSCPPLN